jgi:hypothetical protein
MLLARVSRRRASKEAADAAGGEVARELGPGPALPEDETGTARDSAHADKPVAAGSLDDSSLASTSERLAACSIDSGAACALAEGGDGGDVQVGPQRISLAELNSLWQAKVPVTILDVRTERSLEGEDAQVKGAVRMPPDHVVERARELGLKQEAWLIAYCA